MTVSRRYILWSVIVFALVVLSAVMVFYWPVLWRYIIWPYYVAPIVADAGGDSGGITSAYNPLDTTTYGIILVISVYYIYNLFKKMEISPTPELTYAILPLIAAGGIIRGLEDAELYSEPIQYAFISPMIYVILGIPTVGLVLYANKITMKRQGQLYVVGTILLWACVSLVLGYLFRNNIHTSMPFYTYPVIQVVLGIPITLFLGDSAFGNAPQKTRPLGKYAYIYAFTLPLLIYSVVQALYFHIDPRWLEHYIYIQGISPAINTKAALYITIALLSTITIYIAVIYITKRYGPKRLSNVAAIFLSHENLAIAFAQYLDATATFIAVDFFGYSEKHVVPSFFIDITGTTAVMYILKTIAIITIIYLIDGYYKEEFAQDPWMRWLLKLAFLVLGLAPGTRDALRLIMGV